MTHAQLDAAQLTGPAAADLLSEAVARDGASLAGWDVRSVHRRGTSSLAVVYRVTMRRPGTADTDRLYVAHMSTRPVPDGAARIDVDGTLVHVWPFPRDPYLPGLPTAVNHATTAALLRRLGHPSERSAVRTRSYRPTRRAVVELRAAEGADPAVYLKLLGGRRPHRVRDRTRRLVAIHDELLAAGLPVPAVLEHDLDLGRATLDALPGPTLRQVLRGDGTPPPADAVAAMVHRLHAQPPPDAAGDPDAFADVSRHVDLLRRTLPRRAADLDRLAAVAAGVGGPVATVHGDLHDGQLLVSDDDVTGLLDVDGLGSGHVAHDVGRLLAGVEASSMVVGSPRTAQIRTYGNALHGAFADHAPASAIAAAVAAAWVGLATGPLRVASPTWRRDVGVRLERAMAWAARAD